MLIPERPLSVLYVEDDPALRGILGTLLAGIPNISIDASVDHSRRALEWVADNNPDVALLDVALSADDMTGIELGVALRRLHPKIGIVLLSQHSLPGFLTRIDPTQRTGWSFILKRADLHPRYLADVLIATSRGLNVTDPAMVTERASDDSDRESILGQLSGRQRDIMALLAQGIDAPAVAAQLSLTPATVRQELSRVYQVLVPSAPVGADLRTLAVLRYLREVRSFQEPSK